MNIPGKKPSRKDMKPPLLLHVFSQLSLFRCPAVCHKSDGGGPGCPQLSLRCRRHRSADWLDMAQQRAGAPALGPTALNNHLFCRESYYSSTYLVIKGTELRTATTASQHTDLLFFGNEDTLFPWRPRWGSASTLSRTPSWKPSAFNAVKVIGKHIS